MTFEIPEASSGIEDLASTFREMPDHILED
jgi:hypothetical protein